MTASPAIPLPWGTQPPIPLEIPARWVVTQAAWPDLTGIVGDYPREIHAALDHPEGGIGLEDLVKPGSKVAIVVDDPSRWTPVREALPQILRRLRSLDVSISAGVGRHAAVDAENLRKRVGSAVFEMYSCFSPPVDNISEYVDLGVTPEGVPVRVFRPVAEAMFAFWWGRSCLIFKLGLAAVTS